MKPSKLIDTAIRRTYTTSEDYDPATVWIEDLNEVLLDLNTTIQTEVNEDYFYNMYTTSLVADENEYTFEMPTDIKDWMNKLKYLYVKYDNKFVRARYVSEATMQSTPFNLEENASTANPIWNIADFSVFIYPAPKTSVANWLKASVTVIPKDVLLSDAESAIKIPRQYHKVIILWLMQLIYQWRWMLQEANNALSIYEQAKNDLVRKMSDRDLSPLVTWIPNLSYYE